MSRLELSEEFLDEIAQALNLAELYITAVKDSNYRLHTKATTTLTSSFKTTEELVTEANKKLSRTLKGTGKGK